MGWVLPLDKICPESGIGKTQGPSASLGMTKVGQRTDAVHFDDQWNSRVTNLASCLPVLVRVWV